MIHPYDTFDYKVYWKNREYEHNSEVIALENFLKKIPKIRRIIDIGCGYGRLCPYYKNYSEEAVLADPSKRSLIYAKKHLKDPTLKYIKTNAENLPKKVREKKFDLAILVRVLHHMENPEQTIGVVKRILSKNGYFILEFANKLHYKAIAKNLIKGNFTYPLEIFPTDKRSGKNKNKKTLPFLNYHPDYILDLLKKNDFKIIDMRSVSNIRHGFFKKYFPLKVLIIFEKYFQKPLSFLHFGPSVFILAQKE